MTHKSNQPIVVFTDLDGTLLDEENYSADLALTALQRLQADGVSVIFCSSKTRREQEVIQAELKVIAPFIVENGSAIIVPPNTLKLTSNYQVESDGSQVVILGKPFTHIQAILKEIRLNTGLTFVTFCDLSVEQVVQITGLDEESAVRAKLREYSDSVVTKFSSEDLAIFLEACNNQGLQCAFGGRFLGITAKGASKGDAVKLLIAKYSSQYGPLISIGIGDSPNDASMLAAVDHAFLVQRPNGAWRDIGVQDVVHLPAVGPRGFCKMVDEVVKNWLS